MSAIADVAEALEAALKTIPTLRVYRDPGASVDPPGAVLGPPSLVWEGICSGPTSATFPVYVIERPDDRSLERLWDLVPLVADAVDRVSDAVVVTGEPATYVTGTTELPCYQLTIEVSV